MQQRNQKFHETGAMLNDKPKCENCNCYKYAYYSQLILSGVLAFVCGLLTCHVFEF